MRVHAAAANTLIFAEAAELGLSIIKETTWQRSPGVSGGEDRQTWMPQP